MTNVLSASEQDMNYRRFKKLELSLQSPELRWVDPESLPGCLHRSNVNLGSSDGPGPGQGILGNTCVNNRVL